MESAICALTDRFQSTPLREGRPRFAAGMDKPPRYFNPRPCARGDHNRLVITLHDPDFNPRPCARGDRKAFRQSTLDSVHFNPRPCARGDIPTSGFPLALSKFQSTPLREGRL